MSIIYDSKGFPHKSGSLSYDNKGFLQQELNLEKGLVSENVLCFLKEWFSKNQMSTSNEEQSAMRIEWDEYTKSPNEVYIMIGNGFDLECGLPTSYADFLNFLNAIIKLNSDSTVKVEDLKLNSFVASKLVNAIKVGSESIKNWREVLNNFWFNHFKNAKIKLGWVDFENEIAKIIKVLENSMDYVRYHRGTMDDYVSAYETSELYVYFEELLEETEVLREEFVSGVRYTTYKLLYQELRDMLLKDLNSFIRGFETYLREYVETIYVEPTENVKYLIEQLKGCEERFVLSFNYTRTLERLLAKADINAEFCYVHGKVGDGNAKNQMVLGIDEYLGEEGIKNLIGYAPFRKYNQRIFKATDSNYMDWLDDIADRKALDRMLYIFGHSIGITDKDIIYSFVMARDMRTVLYYHNEDAFSNQVSNMTAIIGMM